MSTTNRLSKHPLYCTWTGMKQRCSNTNNAAYKYYGGRGIKVCKSWLESPQNFIDDMGPKPAPEYSIDRIDNGGNYSCGHCEDCKSNGWTANCRWATAVEQANNRRQARTKHTYMNAWYTENFDAVEDANREEWRSNNLNFEW